MKVLDIFENEILKRCQGLMSVNQIVETVRIAKAATIEKLEEMKKGQKPMANASRVTYEGQAYKSPQRESKKKTK